MGSDRGSDRPQEIADGLQVSLKLLVESPHQLPLRRRDAHGIWVMVRIIHHPDFKEGVRALLIDKDNKPNWHPTNPAVISDAEVDAFFEPLPVEEQWRPFDFRGISDELRNHPGRNEGAVTLVTLNRPQALNAQFERAQELIDAFAAYDADDSQRCLVLTGSKAFAAGADIRMQGPGLRCHVRLNFFAGWERVTRTRKPWIAAVAGFALGGGCEVAMMAVHHCRRQRQFGQPEIKLGVSPAWAGRSG
jgi:enoyl-CoA hydratase/carnithine racemase